MSKLLIVFCLLLPAPVSYRSEYVYGLFGSPGTGKTYFVYYLLDRLIRRGCLLIWTSALGTLCLIHNILGFSHPLSISKQGQIYNVIDGNIDDSSFFSHDKYQFALTHFHLFVTSGLPNTEFYKFVAPREHYEYMPTWSALHCFSFIHFQCGILLFLLCLRSLDEAIQAYTALELPSSRNAASMSARFDVCGGLLLISSLIWI